MNQDETVALFLQGKEAWNAWAEKMLAERKAMVADGRWAAEEYYFGRLEPKNDETGAWIKAASADFSRCLFLARETKAQEGSATPPVKTIALSTDAIDFSGFIFPGDADFQSATFAADTDFRSAIFTGLTYFESATFTGDAYFESATFTDRAHFRNATFTGLASFDSATFTGDAYFESATFTGPTYFDSATFTVDADFRGATFTGPAYFITSTFTGLAHFRNATFTGLASFDSATFTGPAAFESATFTGPTYFDSATFTVDADFRGATFTGPAYFITSTFTGLALFRGQTFTNDIFFNGASFGPHSKADFGLATFERVVQFDEAVFEGEADFNAVSGKRTFSMARARFKGVPNFVQAHFEEAPRLDNVVVEGRLLEARADEPEEGGKLPRRTKVHRWLKSRSAPYRRAHYNYRRVKGGVAEGSALRDMPARWRALKRLAIQGHDTDRELQFFSGEVRSQRFAEHWPLPWPVWKLEPWGGALSFWAGLFYQMFSNFGRSLARPFGFWLLAVVAAAIFYAAQSPSTDMVHRRTRQEEKGAWPITSSISGAWHAWLSKRVPCYSGEPTPPKDKNGDIPPYVGALSPSVTSGTDVANEAWHLAFRNAFIVLDGSSEAAHRTYGCLYGVELYGGSNPLAVVPSAVSSVSAMQKLFSALMIFLFGLALRNMLKMK